MNDQSPRFHNLLETTIQAHLHAAQRGELRLRVPKLKGRLRRIDEMAIHVRPEMFFQISGTNELSFPEEGFRLTPGDICIVPRIMPHDERHLPENGSFCMLVVMYHDDGLSLHITEIDSNGRRRNTRYRRYSTKFIERLERQLDDVVETFHSIMPGGQAAYTGLICAQLAALLEMSRRPESRSAQREHHKVALCRNLIEREISNPDLNVVQLAEWIECSGDYLSNLFSRETGTRLTQHINTRRMYLARRLLRETTHNVSEVAWACGYRDPGYFSRLFRKMIGDSPIRYRQGKTSMD